jgi:hypothetical protein
MLASRRLADHGVPDANVLPPTSRCNVLQLDGTEAAVPHATIKVLRNCSHW